MDVSEYLERLLKDIPASEFDTFAVYLRQNLISEETPATEPDNRLNYPRKDSINPSNTLSSPLPIIDYTASLEAIPNTNKSTLLNSEALKQVILALESEIRRFFQTLSKQNTTPRD